MEMVFRNTVHQSGCACQRGTIVTLRARLQHSTAPTAHTHDRKLIVRQYVLIFNYCRTLSLESPAPPCPKEAPHDFAEVAVSLLAPTNVQDARGVEPPAELTFCAS